MALQSPCPARDPAGNWKYLKIGGNEFLFDVVKDQRERANLAKRHPEVFARLKAQREQWDKEMLPITAEVRTHGVSGNMQADRYGVPPEGEITD